MKGGRRDRDGGPWHVGTGLVSLLRIWKMAAFCLAFCTALMLAGAARASTNGVHLRTNTADGTYEVGADGARRRFPRHLSSKATTHHHHHHIKPFQGLLSLAYLGLEGKIRVVCSTSGHIHTLYYTYIGTS